MTQDPTVQTAMITLAGTIISGLLVYLGSRYTQRQVALAAAGTAATEAERVDLARLDQMSREIQRMDQRYIAADTRHAAQIRQLRRDHDAELESLRDRLGEVEQKHTRSRAELRILTEYARTLLRLMREQGIAYPDPPPGLD